MKKVKIKTDSRWKELLPEQQLNVVRYINHLASGGKHYNPYY